VDALLRAKKDIDRAPLERFVDVLAQAKVVHVAAARGAFGLATIPNAITSVSANERIRSAVSPPCVSTS